MNEIVRINLDNEMDLILVHKRAIKLAELCGLSLSAQTTFATAVSEISRCAISYGEKSHLILAINPLQLNKKELTATIYDNVDLSKAHSEAFAYAKRLIGELDVVKGDDYYEIRLNQFINFSGTLSPAKIQSFKDYFKNEPPISPYDEIRKKNIQLIDLANKLQQSEQQYQMLTDTLPLMMFVTNQKGEINYSNKWLKDFFGNSASSGTSVTWQSILYPDDYIDVSKEWERAKMEKVPFRAQARLRHKTGSYIWHLITIVPSKRNGEETTNWIGFFVDINSQKQVEETLKDNRELKKAQTELELKINELNSTNKKLEQFAFIASHDLQEPLRKIRTFLNLLEKSLTLDEFQASFFNRISNSAERMSDLIRDILNYSLLSEAALREETDLNITMENVIKDLDLLILDKKADIQVSQLPVLNVIPLQISQLFSNLLHNSLKFSSSEPHIIVSSKLLTKTESSNIPGLSPANEYFHIKLKDNGIGFDPKYAEKIFTIFQRLNDLETKGTGIGLALCKKIVENHNGVINATSEINKGATFNIFLPSNT